jgi:hypothetical protein
MNLIVEIGVTLDVAFGDGRQAIGLLSGAASWAEVKSPASGGRERLTQFGEGRIAGSGAGRIARVGLALDTLPGALFGTLFGGARGAGRLRCLGALVAAWRGTLWVWVHESIAFGESGPVAGCGAAGS